MYACRLVLLLGVVWIQAASAAPAQVVLTPKFEEGAEFKVREQVKLDQGFKLAGQNADTEVDVQTVSRTAHGQRNEQGAVPVSITTESLVVDMKLPGGLALRFDSAQPDVKAPDPNLEVVLGIFRKLSGLTLTETVSQDLKVQAVEGVQEGTGLNPDELKDDLQQSIDMWPKQPIEPGHTWEQAWQQSLGQGQAFTFQRRFTYEGTVDKFPTVKDSKKLDKITAVDSSVVYALRPDSAIPGTVKKSDLKVEASKHTLLFDRELGRVVKADSEVRVKGSLTLSIMGMELPGELDLGMTSKREEVP